MSPNDAVVQEAMLERWGVRGTTMQCDVCFGMVTDPLQDWTQGMFLG